MPPQPHPPVAEGAWLRPRPARQSPDCRRGRVHRHASRRPKRVRLKAAAFPAQHIRSALSQGVAVGSAHAAPCGPFGRFASLAAALRFAPAHFRLRRIPAGRRVRMRRGLPSPGSVGIPPVTGSAASRLPPSASPAVTASASCRRPSRRSALQRRRRGGLACRSIAATYGYCPIRKVFTKWIAGKSPAHLEKHPCNYETVRSLCSEQGARTRTAETDMCR